MNLLLELQESFRKDDLMINWKVRFRNPMFIAQILIAIFLPMLTYFGFNWSDMTTWSNIINLVIDSFKNPVVLVAIATSLFNAINDPTTEGFSDSARAITYDKPM